MIYSDANFVDDSCDIRSTICFVCSPKGAAILLVSKRKTIFDPSTTDVAYV